MAPARVQTEFEAVPPEISSPEPLSALGTSTSSLDHAASTPMTSTPTAMAAPSANAPLSIMSSPDGTQMIVVAGGRRKTKLCKLWLENRCRRRRCPFAHGEAELRPAPGTVLTPEQVDAVMARRGITLQQSSPAPSTPSGQCAGPIPVEVTPSTFWNPSEQECQSKSGDAVTPRSSLSSEDTPPMGPAPIPAWTPCMIVPQTSEVEEFSTYALPNSDERAQRKAIRDLIQTCATGVISPDATTKLSGATAIGVECHKSVLDLVVEVPTFDESASYSEKLQQRLASYGIAAQISADAVRFNATSLARFNPRWSATDFDVVVRFSSASPCYERKVAKVMASVLKHYPNHSKLVMVCLSIMQHYKLLGVHALSSDAAVALCIAFLRYKEASPNFHDLDGLLPEFFSFYSAFDFSSFAIQIKMGPPFVPKVHTDAVSIIDPSRTTHNLAEGCDVTYIQSSMQYIGNLLSGESKATEILSRVLPIASIKGRASPVPL